MAKVRESDDSDYELQRQIKLEEQRLKAKKIAQENQEREEVKERFTKQRKFDYILLVCPKCKKEKILAIEVKKILDGVKLKGYYCNEMEHEDEKVLLEVADREKVEKILFDKRIVPKIYLLE